MSFLKPVAYTDCLLLIGVGRFRILGGGGGGKWGQTPSRHMMSH